MHARETATNVTNSKRNYRFQNVYRHSTVVLRVSTMIVIHQHGRLSCQHYLVAFNNCASFSRRLPRMLLSYKQTGVTEHKHKTKRRRTLDREKPKGCTSVLCFSLCDRHLLEFTSLACYAATTSTTSTYGRLTVQDAES